jgi:hypothetical protein
LLIQSPASRPRAIVRQWSGDNGACQVENQVGVLRRRYFVLRRRLKSCAEADAWLMDRCIAWAKAHPHPELRDKTIRDVFNEERPRLVPDVGRFDGFHAVPASVPKS